MSPLYLDFHRKHKPTPWIGLLLVTLGVVALLWVGTQQDILEQSRSQVETLEASVKLKKQQLAAKAQAAQKETPVNEKVGTIRRQQQRSALPSLQILESSWDSDMAILRLDVSPADATIKMDIETRTAPQLLNWYDRISHQPGVTRVVLARQQTKVADPFKPTQASVEVQLRKEAAPAKIKASQP